MIDMLAFIVSGLIGCVLLLQLTWSTYKKFITGNLTFLPGDWPFIGHLLSLRNQKEWEKTRANFLKESGLFGIFFLHRPVVVTTRIEIWEDLLSSQKFLHKGFGYWVLEKILGNGLAMSEGNLWKRRRKMITPAFHFDILNDFISVMENQTFDLIEFIQKTHSNGEPFDIFKMTRPYTMSIMCATSMGLEHTIEETNTGSFKRLYEKTFDLILRRFLNPFHNLDWVYSFSKEGKEFSQTVKNLSNFVTNVIERRIQFRNGKSPEALTKKRIFIDIMLDAYEKGEIDVEGILDEVKTFINAGYETTSTTLAWCLYCLGRNQRVQDKLHEELLQFKKSKFKQIQDFKEFIYLDLVIKETLRLHSTVPRLGRSIPKGTTLGGVTFPSCTIAVDINNVNRNPDVWENPMEFIPERFENFEENKRSAFMYIPFSAGPRNCIGQRFAMMELKIALFHLICTFRVTSPQKESELEETFYLTHGCKGGLFISLEKRS